MSGASAIEIDRRAGHPRDVREDERRRTFPPTVMLNFPGLRRF